MNIRVDAKRKKNKKQKQRKTDRKEDRRKERKTARTQVNHKIAVSLLVSRNLKVSPNTSWMDQGRATASRAEDGGIAARSSHASDLNIGIPVYLATRLAL